MKMRTKFISGFELFLVVSGALFIGLTNSTLQLDVGVMVVIPMGTLNRLFAPEEVCMLFFDPNSTLNMGDAASDLTLDKLEKI
ncbi:MAG: mannose-6-phosphate isomerase-like protein (cupin superfamily) [Litorivivens sp.]|jgi:mannose-6-phosphate isomerase-like protein (cupin superfamily)